MDAATLVRDSEPFLHYLAGWHAGLREVPLEDVVSEPARAAVLSADVINAFCYTGPLASPRIQKIIDPVVALFRRAHAAGVRNFVLAQEAHEPDALEFNQYAPHGVKGTADAEAVPEIRELPFYGEMTIVPKNSISASAGSRLEAWLRDHPEVDTFVVVGDCTDLCAYQLAMHLRLRANERQLRHRVVVPETCMQTYDLPVETAREIGAVPHPGDLLHLIFLYNMMLNGVEIVRAIR